MSESNDGNVREVLRDNGIYEAHRLIGEYRCYRKREDGEDQEVLVRIYDMGPESPRVRYSWKVTVPTAEERGPVPANSAESVEEAGRNVRWQELDSEERKGT